ncbi:MAG TPA: WD40 repeat domain-containing protein [Ktedonobacterales bacterium]
MDPELLWQHAAHREAIYGLACSYDGRLLASCGADGTVRVLRSTSRVGTFKHPDRAVFHDLAFVPTAELLLAVACSDGYVWLWDADQERVYGQVRHQRGEVLCIAWSPTGGTLAWGASDGSVCIWDSEARKLRFQLSHRLPVRGIAFHPIRPWLASASEDGKLCLWELTRGVVLATLVSGTAWVSCVTISPNGSWLAAGLEGGEVVLINLENRQVSYLRGGHTAEVQRAAFSPQSRLCATSSTDGAVAFWSVERQKRMGVPISHPAAVGALVFLPSPVPGEAPLVTGDDAGHVRCWSLAREWLL